ncbi:MAG TPA: hypothetical protein VGK67_08290 [Myxococcales bacterium]
MEELVHKDSVRVGLSGSVFLLQYEQTATMAAAKMLDDVLVRRFDATPGGKWAIIVVIDASHPPPDNDTRDAISKAMKNRGDRVSALAYVVLGSGFRAGAVRAALVTLNLLSQAAYPNKVFLKMNDAVDWIGATAPGVLKAFDVSRTKLEIEAFQNASHAPAPKPGAAARV